jgi:hypothetical protein
LDTMPIPIFMERNPVIWKTLSGMDLGIIHYGYINANSSKLSTKVSNFLALLHLLLLVKTVYFLIIIVNCRLFVHSKRHRTDHQYRICCLFHFVFYLCSTITRYIYTKN